MEEITILERSRANQRDAEKIIADMRAAGIALDTLFTDEQRAIYEEIKDEPRLWADCSTSHAVACSG